MYKYIFYLILLVFIPVFSYSSDDVVQDNVTNHSLDDQGKDLFNLSYTNDTNNLSVKFDMIRRIYNRGEYIAFELFLENKSNNDILLDKCNNIFDINIYHENSLTYSFTDNDCKHDTGSLLIHANDILHQSFVWNQHDSNGNLADYGNYSLVYSLHDKDFNISSAVEILIKNMNLVRIVKDNNDSNRLDFYIGLYTDKYHYLPGDKVYIYSLLYNNSTYRYDITKFDSYMLDIKLYSKYNTDGTNYIWSFRKGSAGHIAPTRQKDPIYFESNSSCIYLAYSETEHEIIECYPEAVYKSINGESLSNLNFGEYTLYYSPFIIQDQIGLNINMVGD